MINKHSHSIITIVMLILFYAILPTQILLFCVGLNCYWLGREYSQAEYRYLEKHKLKRSEVPWYIGVKKESWNKDSLFNDLIIPWVVSSLFFVLIKLAIS